MLDAEHTTLYRSVYEKINQWVASGKYAVDASIPSERKLCDHFQVSRLTVRRAIDELINDGILYRRPGAGTFVGPHNPAEKKQSFRGKVFKVAHVVLGYTSDSFGSEIVSRVLMGVEQEAKSRGFELSFSTLDVREGTASELKRNIDKLGVDGIIMEGFITREIAARIQKLIPAVVVSNIYLPGVRTKKISGITAVLANDFEIGLSAAEYLSENGHVRVGMICSDSERGHYAYDRRYWGFRTGVGLSGMDMDDENWIIYSKKDVSLRESLDRLFSGSRLPTALFACGDQIGVNAMRTLQELGLKVPEDVSIIGVNDLDIAGMSMPGLTTFRIDWRQMGKVAMAKLSSMISGKTSGDVDLLDFNLIERESVKKL